MSYSFKLTVGHGRAPAACTQWIMKAYGPFTVSSARLSSSGSKTAGQIGVVANLGGSTATLYLVPKCGWPKHKEPPVTIRRQ